MGTSPPALEHLAVLVSVPACHALAEQEAAAWAHAPEAYAEESSRGALPSTPGLELKPYKQRGTLDSYATPLKVQTRAARGETVGL